MHKCDAIAGLYWQLNSTSLNFACNRENVLVLAVPGHMEGESENTGLSMAVSRGVYSFKLYSST